MPWLTDAQSGFVVEQSAHVRLVSSCESAWRIFRASGFVIFTCTRASRSGPVRSGGVCLTRRSHGALDQLFQHQFLGLDHFDGL